MSRVNTLWTEGNVVNTHLPNKWSLTDLSFFCLFVSIQLLGKLKVMVQTKDQQRGVWHRGSSSVGPGKWLESNCKKIKMILKEMMLPEKTLLILPFLSAVHVHNDFLLAILTRCQIIVSTPGKNYYVVYMYMYVYVLNMLVLCFIHSLHYDRLL